jgi:outer membrane protein assembly factor BamB
MKFPLWLAGRLGVVALGLFAATVLVAAAATPVVEDLGEPVRLRTLALPEVTGRASGRYIAWGTYETAEKNALVGINVQTGAVTWVDVTAFGRSHLRLTKAADGTLIVYTGNPGHFLRYDPEQRALLDLGVPAKGASYWLGHTVGPDGRIYVGTFPNAVLVRCDPRTGKVDQLGQLATDRKQSYITTPAVSADNVVYCPVGLHHRELWSVDAVSGEKKQILPAAMTQAQGAPTVWTAADGNVYGRSGATEFRCRRDGIEVGPTLPPRPEGSAKRAGDQAVGGVDATGQLMLTEVATGRKTYVATEYAGAPRQIYSVSCERDGRIFGGTFSPANTFAYDPRNGAVTDYGVVASGPIQVYDTLNHAQGLFLSSYMNASVDRFDPAQPVVKGRNPRHAITVPGQERPTQLVEGPDGFIYTGTVPSKGRLGGALVRVDPVELTSRVRPSPVVNQSVMRLVAVPETGELFCTTSIQGGSSAIPTEKSAYVFLWDCREQKEVFRAQPVPGAISYGAVVRARNGLIYGLGAGKYYVFDPRERRVVFTGELPVKDIRFPGLSDVPVGPRGLIYGIGDNAVFSIDPADHSVRVVVRDPALARTHGFFVNAAAVLYFGDRTHLRRIRLGAE